MEAVCPIFSLAKKQDIPGDKLVRFFRLQAEVDRLLCILPVEHRL